MPDRMYWYDRVPCSVLSRLFDCAGQHLGDVAVDDDCVWAAR